MDELLFPNPDFQRLVAVELAPGGDKAEFFFRDYEGRISNLLRPFHPWLVAESPDLFADTHGIDTVRRLSGPGRYGWLVSFQGKEAMEAACELLQREKRLYGVSGSLKDFQQQILVAFDARLFQGMAFDEIRRLQFDIETLTSSDEHFPDANRPEDEITLISLKDSTGWEECLSSTGQGEAAMLSRFVSLIAERDPDVLEGHNVFNFDLQYLARRFKMHRIPFAIGRHGRLPLFRNSRFTAGDKTVSYQRCDVYGRHVIDTYQLVLLYDAIHRDMDGHGLKYSAKYFGVNAEDRTYVDGEDISRTFHDDEAKLKAYCLDDSRETDSLSRILSPSYFYQTRLVPLSYQNCVLRGTGQRVDSLLRAEYHRRGLALPSPELPPENGFQGGLTEAARSGVFANVWHLDVRSMYPSIILSDGLSPASDHAGIFCQLLARLRDFRLRAREAANRATGAEKEYLTALQGSFKIMINSFYGYAGFAQGTFNDYRMAAKVAARGREILSLMCDELDRAGARIIEMDTDGVYFQPPEAGIGQDELQARVQSLLPEGIVVELDGVYDSMFAYKSKNYALLCRDGRLLLSGAALKSRGVETYLRDYIREFVTLLVTGRAEATDDLHKHYVEAVRAHSLPLADLARGESLSLSPSGYAKKLAEGKTKRSAAFELALRAPVPYRQGDTVKYYVTGTKKSVSIVDNCCLLDTALADGRRDENIAFYVDKLEQIRKKFQEAMAQGKGE